MSDSAKWVVDLAARISWAWGFQEHLIGGKSTETGCWKYKVPSVVNSGICCHCYLGHFCFSYGKILHLASLHRTFVDILVVFLPTNTVKMSRMLCLLRVLKGVLSFFTYQMIPSLGLVIVWIIILKSNGILITCNQRLLLYALGILKACTNVYAFLCVCILLEKTLRIILFSLHLA